MRWILGCWTCSDWRRLIKTFPLQKYLQTGMHHMKEILFTANSVIKVGLEALVCVHVHTHQLRPQTPTALNIYKRKLQRREAWARRLCVVSTHRAARTCPPTSTNPGPEFPLHAVMRVLGVCRWHRSGSTWSHGCLFPNRSSGGNAAQLEQPRLHEVNMATDEFVSVSAVLRSDLQRRPCVAAAHTCTPFIWKNIVTFLMMISAVYNKRITEDWNWLNVNTEMVFSRKQHSLIYKMWHELIFLFFFIFLYFV